MDYLITLIFIGFWAFLWYKLGYINARLIELRRMMNNLKKELEKNNEVFKKEFGDSNEENIHRY